MNTETSYKTKPVYYNQTKKNKPFFNDDRRRVIGIIGEQRAGKSTVAELIRVRLISDYTILPFAMYLKDMINALIDLEPYPSKEQTATALNNKTLRHAMQTLGTEWGRDCMGDDFWVNRWKLHIARYLNKNCFRDGRRNRHDINIIADDVRFLNEANAIKEMGGMIIEVKKPGTTDPEFNENTAHESEVEWRYVQPDIIIENHGTIEELGYMLADLVNEHNL